MKKPREEIEEQIDQALKTRKRESERSGKGKVAGKAA
jgi:hypothetical protein